MSPVDAVWHLLDFFAPAIGLALIASSIAKLLWRRELKSASWKRLCLWAVAASTIALIGGLVVFGHDGKIATYAAMIVACSAALWWAGFASR